MAGNPKTPKSTAPKTAQMKPGSKGVRVGANAGKGVLRSTAVVGMKKKKY